MVTKLITSTLCLFLFTWAIFAQVSQQQKNEPDITELSQSIAGKNGTTEDRTRRLVNWINTNFKWSYTDYQKRTPEEIIQRRSGNCSELANVLAFLLKKNDISFRWIHEINIQPKNEEREAGAVKLISEKGNTYSAFGLQHNDHVWLEVYNDKSKSWIPADAAVGVVGINDWLSARMAFDQRRQPQVPAVAQIVKDMIFPFAVVVFDKQTGKPLENRSEFYLIDAFNKFYGNKLQKLASWNEWKTADEQLAPAVVDTFEGKANLHEKAKLIEQIAQIYEKLKSEAAAREYHPKVKISD